MASYLVALWWLSGLSSDGFWLFAAGVPAVMLLPGYLRAALCSIVISAALGVALCEIALRIRPELVEGQMANEAFGAYHSRRGGIYELDRHLGQRLRPDHSRRIYYNGYWWHHRTDSDGVRGGTPETVDAIFLGDSMIYGHGVEETDTVSERFAAITGLRVANLGQQGTSPIQAWLRHREIGARLGPEIVFLCFHFNDLVDALAFYTPENLRRFVEEPERAPEARAKFQPVALPDLSGFWNDLIAPSSFVRGMLRGGFHALRREMPGSSTGAERYVPPRELRTAVWPGDLDHRAVAEAAVRAATRRIVRQARRTVVLDLGYPSEFTAWVENLAGELGAEYSPAGRIVLERVLAGENLYLAGDGHWSGPGAAVVAGELARFISPGGPPDEDAEAEGP